MRLQLKKIVGMTTWRLKSASLSLVSISSRLLALFSKFSSRRCLSHLGTGELEMVHSEISISKAIPGLSIMLPSPPIKSLWTEVAMLSSTFRPLQDQDNSFHQRLGKRERQIYFDIILWLLTPAELCPFKQIFRCTRSDKLVKTALWVSHQSPWRFVHYISNHRQ